MLVRLITYASNNNNNICRSAVFGLDDRVKRPIWAEIVPTAVKGRISQPSCREDATDSRSTKRSRLVQRDNMYNNSTTIYCAIIVNLCR